MNYHSDHYDRDPGPGPFDTGDLYDVTPERAAEIAAACDPDCEECWYCEGCDCTLRQNLPSGWTMQRAAAQCVRDPEGREFCCEECWREWREEGLYWAQVDRDESLIDGVGFADPGGGSALRAATPDNPRNLPCPNCGGENLLTPADRARGYQCDGCADRAERGYD